jgi:hypothetical protein
MQGKIPAGFIKMCCVSSFVFVATGECGHQQLEAFPRILSVPPEVLRSTVSVSAVERSHGSFWNTEGIRMLLHLFCWLLTPVQKDNGQTKNLNYPFTGLTTSLNEKVKIFMSLFIGLEQTKLPTLYFMFP